VQARIRVTGFDPPEKSAQQFLGLPFRSIVEHVQLKIVTFVVTNIIVTITVGVKCAPESMQNSSKCTILKEKIQKKLGEGHIPSVPLAPPFECLWHSNPKPHYGPVHAACDLNFIVKGEGLLEVTGSHVHRKSGNILKTVLDRDVVTRGH